MRALICGSRTKDRERDREAIWRRLDALFTDDDVDAEVITGGANGADLSAALWAKENGVKLTTFYPDWAKYGKRAGIVRNLQMLDTNPDVVVAFWDGKSKGTQHTISAARERGLKVVVYQ